MGLNISNPGTNNVVSYSKNDEHGLNGTITFRGNGNHLAIGAGTVANNLSISLGEKCRVEIGGRCRLGGLFIYAKKKARAVIGKDTGITGYVRLLLHEQAQILIGQGCLLATHVDITVSDMHSIIDIASGKRVNPARDVVLEDRVWVGQRSMILKGSHIESGSIIGAAAVVTGRIPMNSLAVGTPAKVIRSGVTWDPKLLKS